MFDATDSSTQNLPTKPSATPTVLSVEQLNFAIKRSLESEFNIVWVQGELSGFKAHTSGHFYFQLKDSKAAIKAVMFKGFNSRLKFKPTDGLEVILRARVTVYEPRGDYQLNVEMMEPVGAGALQKAFEQLKEKLFKEGLFDSQRKRPLPQYPKKIAVVTSPTGAVIQDILNVVSRRNRFVEIILVPTIVQGEAAAPMICEAIQKAWKIPDLDVMIVGRGGGSMEDLWCFNNEKLARLIASSPIPIVSAVGHEVDFTIADFVADVRAPTPSAAAELVVKNVSDVSDRLRQIYRLLELGCSKVFKQNKLRFEGLNRRLIDPRRKLQDLLQRNDDLTDRLNLAIKNKFSQLEAKRQILAGRMVSPARVLEKLQMRFQVSFRRMTQTLTQGLDSKQTALQSQMSLLDSLSPLKTVDRGYAIVALGGKVIKSKNQLKAADNLEVRLADGWISAKVNSTHGLDEKGEFQWTLKKN